MKLFSTSCETVYLGWDSPLLHGVVRELSDRFLENERWGLGKVDCVLPSSQSCRRLEELLQQSADERGVRIDAPRFMTVGSLMDRLYQPSTQLASEFEQTLGWAQSLRSIPSQELTPLLPVPPPPDPFAPWVELAGTLSALSDDLASRCLSFQDVIKQAENEVERRRWELLNRIHSLYLTGLKAAGLSDPSTERSLAISQNRCKAGRTILLVGTSDLSQLAVRMLRSLEGEVIAMIAAPKEEAEKFDEFGSVVDARWQQHRLTMRDELVPAGDMMDQAKAVAEQVKQCGEKYSADEISIGVTDESQVSPIEIELRGCGVDTYRHLGWTIGGTSLGRLLELATTFSQRQTWQTLAALVRHADVHDWITNQVESDEDSECWLQQLDRFLANHFPVHLSDSLPEVVLERLPLISMVRDLVIDWMSSFRDESQSIAAWSRSLMNWLGELYGSDVLLECGLSLPDVSGVPDVSGGNEAGILRGSIALSENASEAGREDKGENGRLFDSRKMGHRTRLAIRAAIRFLETSSGLNQSLDVDCSGDVALEMLVNRLSYLRVLEEPRPNQLDVLGWLDLALDDAPALVVNGFNHPYVPQVVSSDPFLPSSLRQRLPVEGNERRYARDLHALQVVLCSRQSVSLIVGRVAMDQTPTPPSRLLAATDPSQMAKRLRYVLEGKRESNPVLHRWDGVCSTSGITVPSLGNFHQGVTPPVTSLSVTAFRDYLICPYRFFLRHVLKLRPIDDSAGELAANQFGDLIHGALEDYGRSEHCHESDPELIESYLHQYLEGFVEKHYSEHPSSAVKIQVAQAQKRLTAVAKVQAARIKEGWRIHEVEASVGPKQGAKIEVDGKSIPVKGRFDRIDVRQVSGVDEWAILDYKTHGHPPEKKHLKKTKDETKWIDLQLPLYRMMVPFLGIKADPATVRLGYFNISGKEEETKINEADFSEDLMRKAELLVKECVRGIFAGEFKPTTDRVEFDDYGAIMQTGIASQMLSRSVESEGDGQ